MAALITARTAAEPLTALTVVRTAHAEGGAVSGFFDYRFLGTGATVDGVAAIVGGRSASHAEAGAAERDAWALAAVERAAAAIVHDVALALVAEVARFAAVAAIEPVAAAIVVMRATAEIVAGEGGAFG